MDPNAHLAHEQPPYAHNHQPWPPHLLPPAHPQQSPYPSPTAPLPTPSFSDSPYYHQGPPPSSAGSIPRSSSGLSLNMSSLSVASSNAGSVPSTAGALSPVTPLSPTNVTPQQGGFAPQPLHSTFRFAPPDLVHYDQQPGVPGPQGPQGAQGAQGAQGPSPYDAAMRRPPGSSRSSSSSEKSVPRKRSLTTSSMPLSVSVEEDVNFDAELHTPGSLDEADLFCGVENSPVDGSPTSGEHPDEFRIIESHLGPPGAAFAVLGKTSGSNNFVSKLYQCVSARPARPLLTVRRMISDAKSAHFISWTELGTRRVLSLFPALRCSR